MYTARLNNSLSDWGDSRDIPIMTWLLLVVNKELTCPAKLFTDDIIFKEPCV